MPFGGSEYNDWDGTAGRSPAQLRNGLFRLVAMIVGIDHDQMRKFTLRNLTRLSCTRGHQRFRTLPFEQRAQNLAVLRGAVDDQDSGVRKQRFAFCLVGCSNINTRSSRRRKPMGHSRWGGSVGPRRIGLQPIDVKGEFAC